MQKIIDTYTMSSIRSQAIGAQSKVNTSQAVKNKIRYSEDHVKNKQSHMPFAKAQPKYAVDVRYETTSGLSIEETNRRRGEKLMQISKDRNEQNRKFKKLELKSNYQIGYYQGDPLSVPASPTHMTMTMDGANSSSAFRATPMSAMSSSPKKVNPNMMS